MNPRYYTLLHTLQTWACCTCQRWIAVLSGVLLDIYETLLCTFCPLYPSWGGCLWFWRKYENYPVRQLQRLPQRHAVPPTLQSRPRQRWLDSEQRGWMLLHDVVRAFLSAGLAPRPLKLPAVQTLHSATMLLHLAYYIIWSKLQQMMTTLCHVYSVRIQWISAFKLSSRLSSPSFSPPPPPPPPSTSSSMHWHNHHLTITITITVTIIMLRRASSDGITSRRASQGDDRRCG